MAARNNGITLERERVPALEPDGIRTTKRVLNLALARRAASAAATSNPEKRGRPAESRDSDGPSHQWSGWPNGYRTFWLDPKGWGTEKMLAFEGQFSPKPDPGGLVQPST
jgi:hypothetical protein